MSKIPLALLKCFVEEEGIAWWWAGLVNVGCRDFELDLEGDAGTVTLSPLPWKNQIVSSFITLVAEGFSYHDN